MTETLDGRPRLGEISESGVTEYKPLSGLAVTGLVFGLLSPLAFVGPVLYIFGIAGVVLSVAALVRIGTDSPAITGRKLALVGLVLSTLCISIAPSHRLVTRYLLRNEARQLASAWFRFLGDDQPHKAHQLSKPFQDRRVLDDQLWDAYAENDKLAEQLRYFIISKVAVRALLVLGDGARIRFYETHFQGLESGNERVDLLYAVSFEDDGQEKTFFVVLNMIRVADGRASWRVGDVYNHVQPDVPPG
jgi:hypothetical protein